MTSGLSTSACNVFNPAVSINGVSHSSYAVCVTFNSTYGLSLATTPQSSPPVACYKNKQYILPAIWLSPDKGLFKGYSIGMGIEINNVLNIKSYYYRYINPGASIFDIPIFQLTFNYSMKN